MSPSFSIVIPVLDGERYLPELLDGVRAQGRDVELLVIDSGSSDRSVALARAGGAEVLEIPKASFGHGRTRNVGAERTSGDLICFLTQDATPLPGWLDAYEAAFALADDVGAAFGPHLPRPDTSVMIARELTEFFAGFTPDGGPALLGAEDPMFLSNVNACYRREAWAQIRFPDVRYAEDQAFARELAPHGWRRAYHPDAAVLHAHDYSPVGFMRRYFDEYRGLHATSGHVEKIGVRSVVRHTRDASARDRAWMREQGWSPARRAKASVRSVTHHASRKFAAAAGSQAHKLPEPVQDVLSLEGATEARGGPKPTVPRPARGASVYRSIAEVSREGVLPLLDPVDGMADAERLHIAVVIPPFRRGSGGHSTIFNLLSRLEERGHTVSTWIYDPLGRHRDEWPAVIRGNLREYFRPISGPVYKGFDEWYGADVALATGWDTVYAVQRLANCRARAYLVQDHEPEFFATSAESVFAEKTYDPELYCVAASPWLSTLLWERYGAPSTWFELGVDHSIYHPRPVQRRRDTVIFYARDVTPRRAVPLGLLALEELKRRRPNVRFVLFGEDRPLDTPFPYDDLGIASPEELSWAYSEATVGLSLSLTNYSLIPQEMLACGLPCVELAGRSIEGVFGADGPIELAPTDPVALADALERLLDDRALWDRRAQEGLAFAAERTWDKASVQVEEGLREALRRRTAPVPTGHRIEAIGGDRQARWEESARTVPMALHSTQPATDRLFERLTPADIAEVVERLEPEWAAHYEQADDVHRRMLTLILGAWYGVPAILEKTGLKPDQPPEDVHAMARGPLAGGGALYYADMLAEIWQGLGLDLADVRRGLDFGSSSGRVVRALQAVYPQADWHGVDPNGDAIAWAREHLPEIDFQVSPQDPPLPFADASFDFVVAISIWSHYAEGAAIRWLDEMHRIIEPGGRLVFSTHGPHSVSYYAQTGDRNPGQLASIRRELYRHGYWFAPEFGEAGDWGVKHTEWGTAFFTAEWLARAALPQWEIEHFAVGQNAFNQDMYVLRRTDKRRSTR